MLSHEKQEQFLKDLQKKYPSKTFGIVNIRRAVDYKRNNYWEVIGMSDDGWEIYLEHSCDEWIIGNLTSAEDMISNLQDAITYCKENP